MFGRTRPKGCPRGRCVEERIAIDAPVETVWAILADFSRWGEWSPLYADTAGTLAPGQLLTFRVLLEDLKPQVVNAEVIAFDAPRLIEYAVEQLGGLVRVTRYVEVTATKSSSCRVANGEISGGLLGKAFARIIAPKVRKGLAGMNENLKARAEAVA